MWEKVGICALSLAIAVVSLAAAVWTVFSGQIAAQGLDAIFLLFVCLMAALVFGIIPLTAIRQGLLKDLRKRSPGREPERRAAAALSPKPQEHTE